MLKRLWNRLRKRLHNIDVDYTLRPSATKPEFRSHNPHYDSRGGLDQGSELRSDEVGGVQDSIVREIDVRAFDPMPEYAIAQAELIGKEIQWVAEGHRRGFLSDAQFASKILYAKHFLAVISESLPDNLSFVTGASADSR